MKIYIAIGNKYIIDEPVRLIKPKFLIFFPTESVSMNFNQQRLRTILFSHRYSVIYQMLSFTYYVL